MTVAACPSVAVPPRAGSAARALVGWRAAAVALIGLQLALALTHAPWRDEWQALQLATHSPSWTAMLANLRYEGHPALWYAVLRAAWTILPSPAILTGVQAMVATATLAVLLWRAPFRPAFSLAIGASHLVLFEYGTMARSYGLGVLLLLGWLALRHGLAGWLCLALMANVSVHFALLSGACAAALVLTERDRSVAGAALWLAGILIAVATVWPAPDVVSASPLDPELPARLRQTGLSAAALVVPFDPFTYPVTWPVVLWYPHGAALGLLAPVLGWFVLRRDLRLGAIHLGLTLAVLAVSVLVYPASVRHLGVVVLFCIAGLWMLAERGNAPNATARIWIGASAGFGLVMAASALSQPFAPPNAVAAWARSAGVERRLWAALPNAEGASLSALFGRPYLDLNQGCLARFQRWNVEASRTLTAAEMSERLAEGAARAGGVLYLLAEPDLLPAGVTGLERVAAIPGGLIGLDKVVYRVTPAGPGRPAGPGGVPACPWSQG